MIHGSAANAPEHLREVVVAGRSVVCVVHGEGRARYALADRLRDVVQHFDVVVEDEHLRTTAERCAAALQVAATEFAAEQRGSAGASVTALLTATTRAALVHVGHTRGYLLRGDDLFHLTATFDRGCVLGRDPHLLDHPDPQWFARLGLDSADVEVQIRTVQPGERWLLCTYPVALGEPADIYRLLRASDPEQAAHRLIAHAVPLARPYEVLACVVVDLH